MPNVLLGMLGINEADTDYQSKLGQQFIYDTINDYYDLHNREVDELESVLVETTTTDHTFGYQLPPFGYMERLGGQAAPAANKFSGKWEVSFPLEDYGKALMQDDVTLAYMNPKQLQAHVDGVRAMDINTRRREILSALFREADWSFEDDIFNKTLSVKSLANGDATLYPPIRGGKDPSTRDRFAVSGYVAADISSTNNPVVTARSELQKDFGRQTGGANIAVIYNEAQIAKIRALPNFVEVEDRYIRSGANSDTLTEIPTGIPGVIEGRTDGAWIATWEWIPAGYQLAIHLNAPRPLIRRVDPPNARAALGINNGLSLVAQDKSFPLLRSIYRNRYGYGVGNRLNGHIMQFKASGSYDVPDVG